MIQFNTLLGRKADCVIDFIDFSSWTGFDNDAGWGIWGWKGQGYQLVESVPLTVNGTSLATVASGAEDAHYRQLAQTLINDGFSTAYVRLGWEMNGGWYPWAANGKTSSYIAAFQHVVSVMRSVKGQQFRFVWCTAQGWQQVPPTQAYPGDSFVDLIGVDAYNESWDTGYNVPESMWNSVLNDSYGLKDIVNFAKAHGKPYAFPEWGTGTRPDGHGGGDSPLFIANMVPLVEGSAFAGYWDYNAGDYNAQLSGTQTLTGSMAAFMAAFGSSTAGGTSSVAVEKATGSVLNQSTVATPVKSAVDTLASAYSQPAANCTNCHVGVVQTGTRSWKLFVWATAAHPSATVSWGFRASSVSLFDPRLSSSAVKQYGAGSSATFTLQPNEPVILSIQS